MASQGGLFSLNLEDEREKTASSTPHRDGDLVTPLDKSNTVPTKLAIENRARIGSGIEDSNSGFDSVVGTSEEDPGYLMESEMQLVKSEDKIEGETALVDHETSHADSTLSPFLHKIR